MLELLVMSIICKIRNMDFEKKQNPSSENVIEIS